MAANIEQAKKENKMKRTATIEILNEGEKIFGSPTYGSYMVREYENDEEVSGGFYETMEEAEAHVRKFQWASLQQGEDNNDEQKKS